jgi:proline iminopeptidase
VPLVPALEASGGHKISWTEAGSGSPLLCHPGGPGMSHRYFGGLPELAAERMLLLLDPRGTGESDRPIDRHAYKLADYAADIEAVREHLGLDRLDVLGHSHGGFVALEWAGSHPERSGRLVLSNTAPRFTDAIRRARQAIVESYVGEPWYADALAAYEAHQAGRYADDAELAALLEREVPFYFPRWADDEQAVAARLVTDGDNADALRHFNERVAGDMDLRPVLARVTAPALVITGELDPFGEPTASEVAEALPNATLVVLPDAGHFIFGESENRGAWARAILSFLAGY